MGPTPVRDMMQVTYPNMMEWFEELGVEMELSDMSFSVSAQLQDGDEQTMEWGSRNGLAGLLAQKTNAVSPAFWRMIREILKFKDDVLTYVLRILLFLQVVDHVQNVLYVQRT